MAVVLGGCGAPTNEGSPDSASVDVAAVDMAVGADAPAGDVGVPDIGSSADVVDAGGADVQQSVDAGATDAGGLDANAMDAGSSDVALPDVPTLDMGSLEAGTPDVGAMDTGLPDVAMLDASRPDVGPPDVGGMDTGPRDVGPPDIGATDTGPRDVGSPDAGTADSGVIDAGPRDVIDASAVDVPTGGCALPLAPLSLPGPDIARSGSTRGTSSLDETSCQPDATGPENVYGLTITSTTGVLIDTASASTTFDTVLSIRRACSELATEVACNDDSGPFSARTSVLRTALAPGAYQLIVDGNNGASGDYALRARFYDVSPNALCSGAVELTAAAPIVANLSRSGGPGTACLNTGGQTFYRFTLQPASVATIRVYPQDTSLTWTPTLQVLDDCASRSCVASDAGAGVVVAQAVLTNPTTSARTYILSVAPAEASATTGIFQISAAVSPLVPTSLCQAAVALGSEAAVVGDTSAGVARSTRCSTSESGREVFYTVDVLPGQRATVRAQPQAGATWRTRLRAFAGCDSTVCRSSAVASSSGGAVTLALDNPSQALVRMHVSVASSTATGGPFDLSVTAAPLSPAPMPYYTLSSIPGACDDVRTGNARSLADDSTTGIVALPWTFRFFSASEAYVSVSSNGFAQLWPSSVGSPSSRYTTTRLPDVFEPNNMIAPFWDDLDVAGTSSNVRTLSLGAAPSRRFVIQWTDWQPVGAGATASDRLTFQAKLFETTGVIEFHYCSVRPENSRNTGGSATIGVENAAGDLGNLVRYRSPGSISTATAFRLTPPG